MQRVLQNQFVQAILIFFAVIGLYSFVQNLTAGRTETITPAALSMNAEEMETMKAGEIQPATSPETRADAVDYTGTHIMPDGTVMTGSGIVIDGAEVRSDGMVALPDGSVLTPVADFR